MTGARSIFARDPNIGGEGQPVDILGLTIVRGRNAWRLEHHPELVTDRPPKIDSGQRFFDAVGDRRVQRTCPVRVAELILETGLDQTADVSDDQLDQIPNDREIAQATGELVIEAGERDIDRAQQIDIDAPPSGLDVEVAVDVGDVRRDPQTAIRRQAGTIDVDVHP